MKVTLKNKCDLFADNYRELSKQFKWNYSTDTRLGALLYTMEDRTVDIEAITRCRKVIKENTGLFSQFKDTTNFMTAVMLSLQTEPEAILKGAMKIYEALKKEGFHSSPFLVLAAISIALQSDPYDYDRLIKSTKSFYEAMKEEHRFLTSSDDYGFAALLAMTDISVSHAIKEMEQCYGLLKEDFSSSNAVQSLSHVLTFSEENYTAKCKRVVDLYHELKKRKCKYGKGIELSFLGVIALINEDTQIIADEIAELKDYIKEKKGFGRWSIAETERMMFCVALVCDDYLTKGKKNTMEMAFVNNVASMILAQQMATMAATSGAAAAAASASN
jgi:hypothetical protein